MRQELAALRREMKKEGIDAYLILSGDDHGSEYVHPYYQTRAFVSGFTGSAGTLLVTGKEAWLWTDGRYFLQAEKELEGSGITLQKAGHEGVPTLQERISALAAEQPITLGFDGRTVPCALGGLLAGLLRESGSRICEDKDLADRIWPDRPAIVPSAIEPLSLQVTGRSFQQKRTAVLAAMNKARADYILLTDLTQIAWLFNLRGRDVACTPVFFAYALLSNRETVLYVMEPEKTKAHLKERLGEDGLQQAFPDVRIAGYHEVEKELAELPRDSFLAVDPATMNDRLMHSVGAGVHKLQGLAPIPLMKAVKNPVEIESTLQAHKKDGLAMVRFLCRLKEQIGKVPLTEISAAAQLDQERRKAGAYELSFPTIAGYGPHGAIIHYQAVPETDVPLRPEGFLLIDSGGQYPQGTTDITRTIVLGPLSEKEKACYTYVLKSHIALASAVFAPGTTGRALDEIARAPLHALGLDFEHGTGHGIGHLLSVHEGPNIISRRGADTAIVPGMITSDEPGVYLENEFGIRLENEILCEACGEAYGFRPITFCPFEREAVVTSLLTEEERQWLDAYHAMVWETLADDLAPAEQAWLRAQTAPLED